MQLQRVLETATDEFLVFGLSHTQTVVLRRSVALSATPTILVPNPPVFLFKCTRPALPMHTACSCYAHVLLLLCTRSARFGTDVA
eukprot:3867356-Rhodomonas_salina.1